MAGQRPLARVDRRDAEPDAAGVENEGFEGPPEGQGGDPGAAWRGKLRELVDLQGRLNAEATASAERTQGQARTVAGLLVLLGILAVSAQGWLARRG